LNLKKIRNLAVILALVILSGSIGYDFGRRKIAVSWEKRKPYVKIENKLPSESKDIDFSLFWEVWSRIERDYIDKGNIKPQRMVWGAIKGMVASLDDPYTVFLPPEENKRAKEDLAGSFEGIGAQLGMKNKRIVVVAPLKGMPAQIAGLKAGDYIIEVDKKDTTNWTLPEAVNNIRGPRGTKVVLTIIREGGNGKKNIEITRGTIQVPSIESELVSAECGGEAEMKTECRLVEVKKCKGCARVAILRLYRFGDRTNGEWEKAVSKVLQMEKEVVGNGNKFAGLIFDLRNNPGGYLQGAVYVASEFIESGVIVRQESTDGTSEEYRVTRKGRLTNIPLVVLVNNGSASASEIVAGAIKDNKRAKLVGVKTFGKGSVQEAQELPGGAGLHVTTAKWLLPSGKWIDKNGIEPDVIIENNAKDQTKDLQMEKAVELLLD
jgi:carboxyl-terminal processing protease